MRIGLYHLHGWAGGTQYIHNLVRALDTLPANRKPDIVLLHRRRPELSASIQDLVTAEFCFSSCFSAKAWLFQRGQRTLALFKQRYEDPELLTAIERFSLDVVFPVSDGHMVGSDVPWLGWIPDFQHRHLPEYFPRWMRFSRDREFRTLARTAPRLVLSSMTAQRDLARFFPEGKDRARVLQFCVVPRPDWFADQPRAVVARYGLPDDYLILSNQFWVHKDHQTVFRALGQLARAGLRIPLVCTGETRDPRHPSLFMELQAELRSMGMGEQVRILGLIPRNDQIQLMRAARAVVQPSRSEGWSTVVEDARALGKAILLSDLEVHKEQAPPLARYFPVGQPDRLAEAIADTWPTVLTRDATRDEAEAQASQPERVKRFASQFMQIAEEVA